MYLNLGRAELQAVSTYELGSIRKHCEEAEGNLDMEKISDNYAENLILQAWLSTLLFPLLLPKSLHALWNYKG